MLTRRGCYSDTGMSATTSKVHGRPVPLRALLLVMMVDSFGYSLVLPTLPFLILQYHSSAEIGGLFIAAHQLCAIAAAPLLGGISDRIGRRTVIGVTVVGTAISYLLFAYSDTLAMLLIARILAGTMAGNIGVLQAAAADQSTPAGRARVMNLLTMAWALGFILGPGISALLPISELRPAYWPGLLAALLTGVSLIAVLFARDRELSVRVKETAERVLPRMPTAWSRTELLLLLAMVAFSQTGLVSMTGFWGEQMFAWTSREVSLLFLWVSVCIVAAQMLLPKLNSRFGEPAALLLCCVLSLASSVVIALQPDSVVVLLSSAPVMFAAIVMSQTLSTTLLSRMAPDERQGVELGIANSVAAVGRVLGPLLCGMLFYRVHATAPFWLVNALFTAALFWFSVRWVRSSSTMGLSSRNAVRLVYEREKD